MVSYIWRDAATVGAASSANKIAFELATGTDDNGHIHQSEFKITDRKSTRLNSSHW